MKKTVLITGTSSGIGKETALFFAKNNWNVIATMISLHDAADLIETSNVFCYELDVTSTESITKAKEDILKTHPTIDVVINNAGLGYRSFVELSEDVKIQTIVDVNLLGVVKVCRAFIPVFRAQNKGQFINITSIAGLVNLPLGNFYHATKQAVESFSECMAYELKEFNISVATVQFGNTSTGFQKNVSKCENSSIVNYSTLSDKIDSILEKKTSKNTDLKPQIIANLFKIAQKPKISFTRYSIGFDANLMKYLRRIFGYKLFHLVIRKAVFGKF